MTKNPFLFEGFEEEDFTSFLDEDEPEPWSTRNTKYEKRPEVSLNQAELAEKKLNDIRATQEEREAVEQAARSILEHQSTGSVAWSAMDWIDSVTTDQKRCVQLLNAALPLSRHLSEKKPKMYKKIHQRIERRLKAKEDRQKKRRIRSLENELFKLKGGT